MKTKTIKSILSKKHKEWVESIEDEKVRQLARHGTFITGGAIASLLEVGTFNDLDIYFKDTQVAIQVAMYYAKVFNEKAKSNYVQPYVAIDDLEPTAEEVEELENLSDSDGSDSVSEPYITRLKRAMSGDLAEYNGKKYPIKVFIKSKGVARSANLSYKALKNGEAESDTGEEVQGDEQSNNSVPKYKPIFLTDNSITLSSKIQLVLRFVGKPQDIHENFDFAHCTCWYDPSSKELGLPQDALVSLMTKELVYTGSKFPLCSLFRMRKFINRGFTVNAGQILKMVMQLQEINLKEVDVLREQLIGVDTTYMLHFLDVYNKWVEEHDGNAPDPTYMVDLIDEVFSDEII